MLEETLKASREKVFASMLARPKYGKFVSAMKLVPLPAKRKALLLTFYAAMRTIDDIVDGDLPLPPKFSTHTGYVLDKLAFIEKLDVADAFDKVKPRDDVEIMILYSLQVAQKLEYSILQETRDIVSSMLFDAQRRDEHLKTGQLRFFPDAELYHHFHLLDVKGTIAGSAKVFSEDPSQYRYFEPLAFATRIRYNLRDYDEDLTKGYVNISQEDAARLGVTEAKMHDKSAPSVRRWFSEQTIKGLELLADHHKFMETADLRLLTRAVLFAQYTFPAEKYFWKLLAKQYFGKIIGWARRDLNS